MKSRALISWRLLPGVLVFAVCCVVSPVSGADFWASAYYAGYHQDDLPPEKIDFKAITHVIHFSLIPKSDGGLNTNGNVLPPAYCSNLVRAAHAAGRKAIVSVGGAGYVGGVSIEDLFLQATSPAHLKTFIGNLTNFVSKFDYDGIDIDWEPLPAADTNQFASFVTGLRSALDGFSPRKLLTVAVVTPTVNYSGAAAAAETECSLFSGLQTNFDQINIMTYRLSGHYDGWFTWFTGPIYAGATRFPGGGLVPSTDGGVTNFVGHGVAPGKLAIGIYFRGDIWSGGDGPAGGVARPRQLWDPDKEPSITNVPYNQLIGMFQSDHYYWDESAQAAYLSFPSTDPANAKFISYEDERTIEAKIIYARNNRLGGVMIFELGDGYRADLDSGPKDALLQTIRQKLDTPQFMDIHGDEQGVHLDFSSLPETLYRVEWKSDLNAGIWITLTNNVRGDGGNVQAIDPSALLSQQQRYYRIKTPP